MTGRAFLTAHRTLFLLLVGLGLLTRVLVPVGWMPHVSDGGVRLVLCSGYGPLAAPSATGHHEAQATAHGEHSDSAPASDQPPSQMGAPCAFALASAPALLLGSVAAITPQLPVAIEARWVPLPITRAIRLAAPPPPAIGPPAA